MLQGKKERPVGTQTLEPLGEASPCENEKFVPILTGAFRGSPSVLHIWTCYLP